MGTAAATLAPPRANRKSSTGQPLTELSDKKVWDHHIPDGALSADSRQPVTSDPQLFSWPIRPRLITALGTIVLIEAMLTPAL